MLAVAAAAGLLAAPVVLWEAGVRAGWPARLHEGWVMNGEDVAAAAYELQMEGDGKAALAMLKRALDRDPASPYRWCDYGEALLEAGDTAGARRAMLAGAAAGPAIGPVLMREANFAYMTADRKPALEYGRRLAAMTPAYDREVFTVWERMKIPTEQILSEGIPDARAAGAFLVYLMGGADAASSGQAWKWAMSKGYVDDALAARYTAFLVRLGEMGAAAAEWARYARRYEPGYPEQNAVFNGGFERDSTRGAFDWQIVKINGAEAAMEPVDGAQGRALVVRFDGTVNLNYGGVYELAGVSAGRWVLAARMRTEGITTDEGIGLRVTDEEAPSRLTADAERMRGTQGWTEVKAAFAVPAGTRLVRIQLVRRESMKFDNKIAGTVYLDSVALRRE